MGKNQHYVPQFYLKNFSCSENPNRINLYNIQRNIFVKQTLIKDQASKSYFYGKDGILEDFLSKVETILAPYLKEILTKEVLEKNHHEPMIWFMILSWMRTEKYITNLKNNFLQLANSLKTMNCSWKIDEIVERDGEYPNLAIEEVKGAVEIAKDLKIAFFINKTNRDLVTSDQPVYIYNFLFEAQNILHRGDNIGSRGVAMFFPVSPKLLILLYDEEIYEPVRTEIGSRDCIDRVNMMTVLNANQNIYYRSPYSEKWISKYIKTVDKFRTKETEFSTAIETESRPEGTRYAIVKNEEIASKNGPVLIRFLIKSRRANIPLPILKFKEEALKRNYRPDFRRRRNSLLTS